MEKSRFAINSIFFINGFVFANWAARIPLLQETYTISHRELGFVLLSASFGALLAMPFTGWLITKQGSRRITQTAALLYLAVVPFLPLLPDYQLLMVVFFIMGMFTGTLDVAMNAQAVMVEQAYKKPIMSFFHAMFSVGMMIGAGTGALFSYFQFTLFHHFSIVALLGLGFLLWNIRHFIPDPVSENEEDNTFFRLPKASLLGIGVIAFCCMLGEGAMSDWSSNYMTLIADASKSTAPIALFAFSLAMTIGRLLGDRARLRFGDNSLLLFGGVMASLGASVIIFSTLIPLTIFGFFMVGLGLSTIVPIVYSQAGNVPGLAPGVGIGMVTTIGYAGFLFGPPTIGFLADWYDLQIAFYFILSLFVVMTILVGRRLIF